MGEVASVLESIAEYAARFGLKPELKDGRLVVRHTEYPLWVTVEPEGPGYMVRLEAGGELEESISELLDEDVDARSELEDVVEVMVRVVDYAVRRLREKGFRVERNTRDAILDVYDALESFLEEEE